MLRKHGSMLSPNDREFFSRVWSTDAGTYDRRLAALGFTGLASALDAGCGMGQWTYALARRSACVHGVDASPARAAIAADMSHALGAGNVECSVQSIERLAFGAGSFDAVFCYSVIYMSDYAAALREFRRVLRPGGRLYICSNGIGWYLRNVVVGSPNPAVFDARRAGLKAMAETLSLLAGGRRASGTEAIFPSGRLVRELRSLGFENILSGGDGTIRVAGSEAPRPFFSGSYWGLEGVYEILATRGAGQ